MSDSIWVLAFGDDVDLDYGFYTNERDAQDRADEINHPEQKRYAKARAEYKALKLADEEKTAIAKAAVEAAGHSFRGLSLTYRYPPDSPTLWQPYEVLLGREANLDVVD